MGPLSARRSSWTTAVADMNEEKKITATTDLLDLSTLSISGKHAGRAE
jgi:hypothetical protein